MAFVIEKDAGTGKAPLFYNAVGPGTGMWGSLQDAKRFADAATAQKAIDGNDAFDGCIVSEDD